MFGKKAPAVVHFDWLKPCHLGTRFPQQTSNAKTVEEEITISTQPSNVFELEIVEADNDDVPTDASLMTMLPHMMTNFKPHHLDDHQELGNNQNTYQW